MAAPNIRSIPSSRYIHQMARQILQQRSSPTKAPALYCISKSASASRTTNLGSNGAYARIHRSRHCLQYQTSWGCSCGAHSATPHPTADVY
ncbi:hypothetical protein AVEN_230559-1 [Araneus ventricosus]|uniref:Uncharacterized protein n=1 Tax=Araneus ventricosus TaxID=182803 RepID=A0A4Y2RM39_ARAVE|nr:hypothetical protein AVEN_230559-1 [Araneus ventricosus]